MIQVIDQSIDKRRAAAVLLIWFTVVLVVILVSPGRVVGPNLTEEPNKTNSSSHENPASPAQSIYEVSTARSPISATVTWGDSDNDGIPDGAELQSFAERENFRRWFTTIAEMQFYQISDQWNPEQRDCAGLVRFAWREALRTHDRTWFQKMGPQYEQVAADVRKSENQAGPLGDKLFRISAGSFKPEDIAAGKFSDFADGQTLKRFNSVFIGRDQRLAEPGDLLFFYQPWVQKFPYHVMIFIGSSHIAPNGADDWVVYHTGGSPAEQGVVKKVELSVLKHHPDPRWRPVESNRNFLGIYRLKILS